MMGKQAKPRILADNEARSVLRNLRISPQKLNEVVGLIRGQDAEKALAKLSFSRRRIANDVKKALESAIANAENNHGMDVDRLVVHEAYVGKALVMKRFRARARGRGARILKPFSHLTIIVSEKSEMQENAKKRPAKKDNAKKGTAKKDMANKDMTKKDMANKDMANKDTGSKNKAPANKATSNQKEEGPDGTES